MSEDAVFERILSIIHQAGAQHEVLEQVKKRIGAELTKVGARVKALEGERDMYLEAFKACVDERDELAQVLKWYAKHEHWHPPTGQPANHVRVVFDPVGDWRDGWEWAEIVLRECEE